MNVDPGHPWARHATPGARWCSVLARGGGSIRTRCYGRWSLTDEYETAASPPTSERCDACQVAYTTHELDQLALGCGDRTRTHAVEAGLRELAGAPQGEARPSRALSDRYARRRAYVQDTRYVPGEEW